MLSKIRVRLTYANVLMTAVLVLAMSGGAYAASKYAITSTKQISPKVLKSLQGKAGRDGAPGSAGAKGETGAAGPTGPAGSQGPQGPKGENGTNGANGTNGKDGSPWTASGTLPKGKTETGTWSVSAGPTNAPIFMISFTLPLASSLGAAEVHYVASTGNGSTCPGSVAKPEAEPGNLCVYETLATGVEKEGPIAKALIFDPSVSLSHGVPNHGAGTSGAVVYLSKEGTGEPPFGYGTWAVTEK